MNQPFFSTTLRAGLLGLGLLLPASLYAQDQGQDQDTTPAEPALSIDLNDAAPGEQGGCRLTFLIQNGLEADLTNLSLETVVLTTEGQVERVTLFDFGELPAGRPRVRQFDLSGLVCESVGQVLINDVAACEGIGIGSDACMPALTLSSRSGIDLAG